MYVHLKYNRKEGEGEEQFSSCLYYHPFTILVSSIVTSRQ